MYEYNSGVQQIGKKAPMTIYEQSLSSIQNKILVHRNFIQDKFSKEAIIKIISKEEEEKTKYYIRNTVDDQNCNILCNKLKNTFYLISSSQDMICLALLFNQLRLKYTRGNFYPFYRSYFFNAEKKSKKDKELEYIEKNIISEEEFQKFYLFCISLYNHIQNIKNLSGEKLRE